MGISEDEFEQKTAEIKMLSCYFSTTYDDDLH